MIDEDFQVVEGSLAIVAPRSLQLFLHVGMTALFLRHGGSLRTLESRVEESLLSEEGELREGCRSEVAGKMWRKEKGEDGGRWQVRVKSPRLRQGPSAI